MMKHACSRKKNVTPVLAATGLFIAPAAYAKVHRVGCVQPRRPHLSTRESWTGAPKIFFLKCIIPVIAYYSLSSCHQLSINLYQISDNYHETEEVNEIRYNSDN
jgi:hypothetical protein